MTLNPLHSAEDEAFRAEIRSFIAEALPEATQCNVAAGREPTRAERVHWQRTLNGRRWAVPHWPMEHGGQDWDAVRLYIFHEELIFGHTPDLIRFNTNLVGPVIAAFGSPELKAELLGRIANADVFFCQGFSEPNAGSDLASLRAHARRDGDDYVINGQKIFISNGINCDFVVLACKTDPDAADKGVSLILVEAGREGFAKGRKLEKIGLHAADTAELFFSDVRVPVTNRISEENGGFKVMMANLVQERLGQAVRAVSVCEAAIEWTVKYTKQREAFGQTIFDFQNTQFVLADLDARIAGARAFTDACMLQMDSGTLDGVTMAQLKLVTMELQGEVLDKCLQFFGGYGYMREYPIARAFVDARLNRIAGGTIEVMKHIIGKDLAKRY
jgi:alkylation response protein AidB-like acyl-CoA dehydrogenase